MTRKDFQLIADAIKFTRDHSEEHGLDSLTLAYLTGVLVNVLPDTNPNFDRERFIKACGVAL